jgi:hypothetical protein
MTLRSFDRELPPELPKALAALADLSPAARAHFADLLAETIGPMPDDQLDNRIVRLCRKLELDPAKLAPPLKSARYLFRLAATQGSSPADLAVDLDALLPGRGLAPLLVPLYERALPLLRQELATASLAAHGKVLAGIEWRVDAIASSDRGRGINLPVVLMTLAYREREQSGSVTMQLLPSMVKELRDVCDRLLSPNEPPPRS